MGGSCIVISLCEGQSIAVVSNTVRLWYAAGFSSQDVVYSANLDVLAVGRISRKRSRTLEAPALIAQNARLRSGKNHQPANGRDRFDRVS